MSYDRLLEDEAATEVVLEATKDESSEEPPMSEWSSLIIKIKQENFKKQLFEQGVYDPGSGEICTAYVTLSDSAVLRHTFFEYPSVPDPGILSALLEPPPKSVYPNDGQKYYLAICENMHLCPVRIFHRGLLETHINLSYYGLNPNATRAMAMALEKNSYVTYLDLTDNWLNDDACFHLSEMLDKNSTLTDLILYGCRIGTSGTRRLCEGLITNKTLRALNLGCNQIGDEGLERLSRAILLSSKIRELNLSHNGISGKGCQHLAQALETQNHIIYLNLSHNNLSSFSSGLCSVLLLLGTNPEFQYLNLSWNFLSGTKIASSIKSVFNSKQLRYVYLNNNRLSGYSDIIQLIGWFGKPTGMKAFDLSYNPLSPADAVLIIRKFQTSKIQALYLEGVNVNETFVRVLKCIQEMRKDVIVTHGNVERVFKAVGPDVRELVLNRIEYLTKKNKKRQVDIALIVLQLLKDKVTLINAKELYRMIKQYGVILDEDLLNAVQELWPGEWTKKGGTTVGLITLAEYIKRKWPERDLPPTPPPEPAPEPVKQETKRLKK